MRWLVVFCLLMIAVPAAAQDTRDADYYARITRTQALAEETALNRQLLREIEDEFTDASDRYHREQAKVGGNDPEKRQKLDAAIQLADEKRQEATVREQRRHERVVREIEQFYADQAAAAARRKAPHPRTRKPKRS